MSRLLLLGSFQLEKQVKNITQILDDVNSNLDKKGIEYDYDMTKLKTQAHFTLVNKYEYVNFECFFRVAKICPWAYFAPELPSSPDEF